MILLCGSYVHGFSHLPPTFQTRLDLQKYQSRSGAMKTLQKFPIYKSSRTNFSKLQVFLAPQIIFAAGCAFAVFNYVYNNIDSIMEKQKVVIEKTINDQNTRVKSVQEQQKEAILKAQKLQQDNITKGLQDAANKQKK